MDMRDLLTRLRRSGIALEIADEEPYRCGGTRFGGRPDVPPGFVWPCFEGTARVFWFEDAAALAPAEYPPDLSQEARFPALHIGARQAFFYPQWEDFELAWPDAGAEDFEEARDALIGEAAEDDSRLLGWPEILQNNMAVECELVTRGYYLGDWRDVPDEVYRRAKQTALDNWLLLFQLGPVASGDFELMFGDGGNLYFYIRREDLLSRRFARAWLISQCS